MRKIFTPSIHWLAVFIPLTLAGRYLLDVSPDLLFISSCLSIIPLAGWLGTATEHLAEKAGEGVGGLLNATFGNAAELIIALLALNAGLVDVVKASITGSIIGNILLVLGGSFLAGGTRYSIQKFNPTAARTLSIMLTLASIGLIAPAMFHYFGGSENVAREADLSFEIALVLITTYGLSLIFSLKTHKQLFVRPLENISVKKNLILAEWSVRKSVALLVVSSVFVGWISEVLVGTVEVAAHSLGMTSVFIGVIVVAIIGNAAEHSTAVAAALKDRMELSIGISVGSSIQVALFVAPVLVFASYCIGPRPMDLVFTPIEVIAIALSALITEQITGDGESTWIEGVQLISVYLIFALVFYFLP